MTAGLVAEKISGKSWDRLVREDIFEPLHMSDTNTSVLDLQKSDDHAQIYAVQNDELVPIPFRNIDAIGPVGSINSNIDDMQKYILMQMNGGRAGDKQILPAAQSKRMQTPQMVTREAPSFPEEGDISYGMGFFISTYRGHRVIYHAGHIDGFSALLSFMPQEKVGMVMLINVHGSHDFPSVVERNLYDRLLECDQINWSQRLRDEAAEARKEDAIAKAKRDDEHFLETHPSHDLSAYDGQYRNRGYGTLTVSRGAKGLQMTYNGIILPLKHYRYDSFEVPKSEVPLPRADFPKLSAQFNLNVAGDIVSVAVPFESSVDPIVFTRVKAKDGP